MSAQRGVRAGVVVTGTEVLGGRISDRNGPWLAQRLQELGIELAHVTIVGDRAGDMRAALEFMATQELDLVITSGGLGPTADDMTAAVVGEFQGRTMVLDEPLEERIAAVLARLPRGRASDPAAVRAANRKQAFVPRGAAILEPVGTAPGLVVAPASGSGPTVVVLPGPPRELQPMWRAALATPQLRALLQGAGEYVSETLRLFGVPESMLAETLRMSAEDGLLLEELEVTTCARGGELEVYTRFAPQLRDRYDALVALLCERHGDAVFSLDGTTVDEQVAALLLGDGRRPRTIATAESCTGGLLAARLTDLAGSSRYVRGAIVAYANDVKVELAGVDPGLLERDGAVSEEVARALADGARSQLGADVGVGVTGVAGPDGGTPEKPVGLVWLSAVECDGARITRSVRLPGGRGDVRDRATTAAMHLLRRLLSGEHDTQR